VTLFGWAALIVFWIIVGALVVDSLMESRFWAQVREADRRAIDKWAEYRRRAEPYWPEEDDPCTLERGTAVVWGEGGGVEPLLPRARARVRGGEEEPEE
jgi:hypothetical protein